MKTSRTPHPLRSVGSDIVIGAGDYGLALGLLLLMFLVISIGPGHQLANLAGTALALAALVVTLRASGQLRPSVVSTILAIGALVVVLPLLTPADDRLVGTTSQLVLAALAITGPLAVIADLIDDRQVSARTIAGALCLYLLVGVTFTFLFGAMQYISGTPFFADRPPGTTADFLYFSLATLTTTGFGDFAAGAAIGRTVAVLEAILGQLWLVTVVGGLVGAAAVSALTPAEPVDGDADPAAGRLD